MNVPEDIAGREPFLRVLDLPPDKVPTVEATRKAYRAKMHLHPDKAGEGVDKTECNTIFQAITEAVTIINLFLADYGDHSDAASESTNSKDDCCLC